jgi:hypothetical protein
MKYLNKKIFFICFTISLLSLAGCKKYTDEQNLANRTAETYFNTVSGFEDLVKSNYSTLRGIVNFPQLFNIGTDFYTTPGTADQNALNLYNNNLNSFNGDVDAFYKQLYNAINIANSTMYWATQVADASATATLNTRVAEAKALRAYYYFLLAETFGDVPLVLTRTTGVTLVYTRAPEKDIYTQIIQDLNDAIAVLPTTTPDFGRATKGFAQHLLSKVYLTRGYKTFGSGNTDFQQAGTLAETVINSGTYSLKPKFSDLFDPTVANFQANPEVIFSVQYSTTTTTNGNGNTLQQWFMWDVNAQAPTLLGRSTFYGKSNNALAPTPAFVNVFDKIRDSRYLATVYDVVFAQAAGSFGGKNFVAGDTLIYYPVVALNAAEKAAKKYFVVNPDEYRTSPFASNARSYPQFKKFRDVTVTSYVDNAGARDTYIFRLAESYLIASEAYFKLANMPKALQYYNVVRARAAKPGNNPVSGIAYATELQATTLTIDNILDERGRELVGEEFRWYELKRTGKLLERALLYNEEAKASNTIKATNLLRPIPQSQIDLNRGSFPQNPGY